MKVEIDPHAGFCFGVTRVVRKAEEYIREHGSLYCLGEIVHNQKEIERLEKIGLKTITNEEFLKLSHCRVLIRAHGEPPETYQHAQDNHIELIDGSCPIVLRLQSKLKHDYDKNHKNGVQFVIFGKKDHAEVRGLAGQTNYQTLIVESDADLDKINFSLPIHLYAQTTMSTEYYRNLQDIIIQRARNLGSEIDLIKCTNSICRQVSGRMSKLQHFCARHDCILFVSYRQSSNGKILFAQCQSFNKNSYFVTDPEDLQTSWFRETESVGITGATSTPRWLLEDFADAVTKLL
jgi:4-hydroxy-3-methylbut-2-enyl diphosphate reductase